MSESGFGSGICSLRDFFSARNAYELQSAASQLAEHFDLPLTPPENWVDVEYDFNRLFIGPLAVPAPLYASAYQDEALLMGAPAIAVRSAYQKLGYAVPDMGATPDDHLAYELDAVALCDFFLSCTESDAHGATPDKPSGTSALPSGVSPETAYEVRQWLVNDHMQNWVPEFIEAVKRQSNVTQPVEMAITALSAWLTQAAVHNQTAGN